MDINIRKYNFIQDLFSVNHVDIIETLEKVLKKEKEKHQDISEANKNELDHRLEAYQKNPDDVLDQYNLQHTTYNNSYLC
jgi:hypothetical protein